jgi:uncharacterized protein (TIGR03435 family)
MASRFIRSAVGSLAIAVAMLFALGADTGQGIVDSWQGTLHSAQDMRIILKISKTDDGYIGVTSSIDEGFSLPPSKIAFDGTTVKMTFEAQHVSYEGSLSADGKTISGTWKQGPNPFPLTLARTTPETEWTAPALPPREPHMDAKASPAFEVATIKPSQPDAPYKGFRLSRHEFTAINENLSDLITFAYGVHPKQVIGAPAWAETEKFDIKGEPDGEGVPSLDQWKTMVQKLLEERCKLSFHHEQTQLAVYVLSVAKTGPKLTPSLGNAIGLPGLGFRGQKAGDLSAYNATIGDFINFMTRNVKLNRPIVDKTGIVGRYDFTLSWTPDDTQFDGAEGKSTPSAESPSTAPSLYTAVQEQLGLRLEAVKAPVDVLVIDRVEKPSEN